MILYRSKKEEIGFNIFCMEPLKSGNAKNAAGKGGLRKCSIDVYKRQVKWRCKWQNFVHLEKFTDIKSSIVVP